MSSTYAPRHRMSATTLLAAKVGFASAALAAAASLARLAVPQLVSVGGAVFPRVWAVARFWLAPPYLFVTVHLIILVIWKLSDHKHFQAQAHHKDPWPVTAQQQQHAAAPAVHAVEEEAVVKAKVEEEFGAYGAGGYLELEPESSPDSGGADSCVTTESDEDNGASSAAPTSYSVEARRHRVAPVHEEHAALQRELSLPAPQDCEGGGGGDDDLDATWNAIMQKTRSAPAAPPPPAQQQSPARPPPRARDPSVGAEEMNRRFDDFIKKNRNSFGRQ